MPLPKMYGKLAPWFHLLTSPADYDEEATFYRETLIEASPKRPTTLLELGSGGGNNALYMKKHFQMTLSDLSAGMLKLSKTINPELEHKRGDMRALRLRREFDAVFVHDAIGYMQTQADLRAAIETASVHTKSGGVALFAPDYTRERFEPSTHSGGHDDPASLKGMRYLEWTWDPDPNDETYTTEYAFILRDADGSTRYERDVHVEGLFSREQWMTFMRDAGFRPKRLPFKHSELESTLEVFVCVKT